ncbi:MAG: acyl carrier protein [Alphaproteobacteria bacterium]|nr:acyl carrier protein [Alphaproteobacteria bacterium]
MDAPSIYQKLTPVFQEVFDDVNLIAGPTLSAKDVPEWDSLNHIRLVVSIESEFKIKFTIGEITAMKNVGDLVALIQKKI